MPLASCYVVALCPTAPWLVHMTSVGRRLRRRLNHDVRVYIRVWCAWMSRLLFLQDLRFKTGINMSFNRDFFPPRSLLYSKCFHQWLGVIFPVYSGELSHRRGLHLGDKPDHCTERVFVRACPTHVLLGTFLLPLQPRPLCQCLGLSGQDDQMSWPLFPSVPSEDPQTH